jgi:hypothetical protein
MYTINLQTKISGAMAGDYRDSLLNPCPFERSVVEPLFLPLCIKHIQKREEIFDDVHWLANLRRVRDAECRQIRSGDGRPGLPRPAGVAGDKDAVPKLLPISLYSSY